jgi:arsenate reductase
MTSAPRIEVLVFEGCPHAETAGQLVQEVAAALSPASTIEKVEVDSPEKAQALGFLGSPSIRINGIDLEGKSTTGGALSCRVYEGGAGVPPRWLIEAALLRALKPKGILFLCVANSARSQMAEGLARSLAPAGIKIWSAGSHPTSVRPEAIAVMKEIGIDISRQRSKAVSEIPAAEVDTVITLCGEEECPLFLGKARRLHWEFADPAAFQGSAEERLKAFRTVRDELSRRLKELLA